MTSGADARFDMRARIPGFASIAAPAAATAAVRHFSSRGGVASFTCPPLCRRDEANSRTTSDEVPAACEPASVALYGVAELQTGHPR
jgi:hypothetical protein